MATQNTGELQESTDNKIFITPDGEEIAFEQDHCILFKVAKKTKKAQSLSNKDSIYTTCYKYVNTIVNRIKFLKNN